MLTSVLMCLVHVTYLGSFQSRVSFHALQPWNALREKQCGSASPCAELLPLARSNLAMAEDATRMLGISGSFRNLEAALKV